MKATREQIKIINKVREGSSVQVQAYAGTAKCVSGSTLIRTSNGLIRIKDIVGEKMGYHEYSGNLTVQSLKGWEKPSHVYSKRASTITVRTRYGYSITCTDNHPLFVINSTGNFVWKEANTLIEGDRLAISVTKKMVNIDGNLKLPSIDYINRLSKDQNKFLPKTVTRRLAKFLGYYLSEGTMGSPFWFWNNSKQLRLDFKRLSKKLFPFLSSVKSKAPTPTVVGNVRFNSIIVYKFMQALGVKFSHSRDVSIPDCILQSPLDIKSNFLRAYFAGDGSLHNRGVISLTSASIKLIKQLQILLLEFGIISTRDKFSVKGIYYYRLSIYSSNVDIFMDKIGFLHDKKTARYVNNCVKGRTYNTNVRVIPDSVKRRIRAAVKRCPIYNNAVLCYNELGKKRGVKVNGLLTTKHTSTNFWYSWSKSKDAIDLASEYPIFNSIVSDFSKYFGDEFFWDEIVLIKRNKKRRRVYDLTLPEGESFIGNGIVNHNTTSVVAAAKALSDVDRQSKKLAVAFNVRNMKDLKERLEGYPDWEVRTLNSLGYGTLMANAPIWNGGKLNVDESKVKSIAKEIGYKKSIAEWMMKNSLYFDLESILIDLISKAKVFGYKSEQVTPKMILALSDVESGPGEISASKENLSEMSDAKTKIVLGGLTKMVKFGLDVSLDRARSEGLIDFNDQVYLSMLYCPHHGRSWDVIAVDEAQDLSSLNHMQVLRACKRQLIVVGDKFQSLYQFRGATEDSMEDMVKGWKKKTNIDMVRLKLSITFRCPRVIVQRQTRTVGIKDFKAKKEAGLGRVFIPFINAKKQFTWNFNQVANLLEKEEGNKKAVILSATNAPLYVAAALLWQDFRCREIADFKHWCRMTLEPPPRHFIRQAISLPIFTLEKYKRQPAMASIHYFHLVTGLNEEAIVKLFEQNKEDENSDKPIIFSTGHRFKGLEADHVYLFEPGNFGETGNLRYVAETRTRDYLATINIADHRRAQIPRDTLQRYLMARGMMRDEKDRKAMLDDMAYRMIHSHPFTLFNGQTLSNLEQLSNMIKESLLAKGVYFNPTINLHNMINSHKDIKGEDISNRPR